MTSQLCRWTATVSLTAVLCACGGGGSGGSGIGSTPAPAPAPAPTPTPAAVPLTGVTTDTNFAAVGNSVQIRWDEQAKTYEVKLPTSEWAALTPGTYGNFNVSLVDGAGTPITSARIVQASGYGYTGTLRLFSATGFQMSPIAFGIPTAASEVPVTGTASYLGQLDGYDGGDVHISGEAKFQFDFGAGTFGGYIHPLAAGAWTEGDLGQYDFVDTVYSKGSPSFSGDLLNAMNSLQGSFSGNFNGPGATELMGKWTIQFDMCNITWCDPANPIASVSGIVVGKKQ